VSKGVSQAGPPTPMGKSAAPASGPGPVGSPPMPKSGTVPGLPTPLHGQFARPPQAEQAPGKGDFAEAAGKGTPSAGKGKAQPWAAGASGKGQAGPWAANEAVSKASMPATGQPAAGQTSAWVPESVSKASLPAASQPASWAAGESVSKAGLPTVSKAMTFGSDADSKGKAKGKGKDQPPAVDAAGMGKDQPWAADAAGKGKDQPWSADAAGKGKDQSWAVDAAGKGKAKGKDQLAAADGAGKGQAKGKDFAGKGQAKGKDQPGMADASGKGQAAPAEAQAPAESKAAALPKGIDSPAVVWEDWRSSRSAAPKGSPTTDSAIVSKSKAAATMPWSGEQQDVPKEKPPVKEQAVAQPPPNSWVTDSKAAAKPAPTGWAADSKAAPKVEAKSGTTVAPPPWMAARAAAAREVAPPAKKAQATFGSEVTAVASSKANFSSDDYAAPNSKAASWAAKPQGASGKPAGPPPKQGKAPSSGARDGWDWDRNSWDEWDNKNWEKDKGWDKEKSWEKDRGWDQDWDQGHEKEQGSKAMEWEAPSPKTVSPPSIQKAPPLPMPRSARPPSGGEPRPLPGRVGAAASEPHADGRGGSNSHGAQDSTSAKPWGGKPGGPPPRPATVPPLPRPAKGGPGVVSAPAAAGEDQHAEASVATRPGRPTLPRPLGKMSPAVPPAPDAGPAKGLDSGEQLAPPASKATLMTVSKGQVSQGAQGRPLPGKASWAGGKAKAS